MKKIGLTGGIGSGKSTIAEVFKILNIPVYNSDDRAKALMNENPLLMKEISNIFGSHIYQNGTLNRAELGAIVFKNPELLQQLNAVAVSYTPLPLPTNRDVMIQVVAVSLKKKNVHHLYTRHL